jgi:hypothetical protein
MSYNDSIRVLVPFSYVYPDNPNPTLNHTIELISTFDRDALSIICAKLTLFLTSDGSKDMQNHLTLIEAFIGGERFKILQKSLEQHTRDNVMILAKETVLMLSKLNLEHNKPGGYTVSTPSERDCVARILFSLNSLWMDLDARRPPGSRGDRKGTYESLRISMAKQYLSGTEGQVINLLARGNSLVQKMIKRGKIDVENTFLTATGMELELYMDMIFMIIIGWSIDPDINNIDEIVLKDFRTYFSNSDISSHDIDAFAKILSFDANHYNKLNKEMLERVGMVNKDQFDTFLTFMVKPLMSFGEAILCISPDFLSHQLTEGPYNIIREELKKTNRGNDLPNEWGLVYEEYIIERLVATFGDQCIPKIIDSNGSESIDAIIELENCALLIEIKYPHWSYKARAYGLKKDMYKFISKFARYKEYKEVPGGPIIAKKKGLGQIKSFYEKLQTNQIKTTLNITGKQLIPVVILGEDYPVDPFNRQLIDNFAIEQECVIKNDNVLPYIILTTEEVEMIESLIEYKDLATFEAAIMEYSTSFTKAWRTKHLDRPTTFKNTLYQKKLSFRNNAALRASLDQVSKRVHVYFQKQNIQQKSLDNSTLPRSSV